MNGLNDDMNREISDRNILDRFCLEFCRIIEKHCKYIVVSGFIAIASGRTRGTEDIDMIIERIDIDKFRDLYTDLLKNRFICIQSENVENIYNYLKNNTSLRFVWKDTPLPEMEIKFVKDKLDEFQLDNRTKIEQTQLDVWFSDIETNIAFKEKLLKSPKDMEDAKHLRIVYSDKINEDKIKTIKELIKKWRL